MKSESHRDEGWHVLPFSGTNPNWHEGIVIYQKVSRAVFHVLLFPRLAFQFQTPRSKSSCQRSDWNMVWSIRRTCTEPSSTVEVSIFPFQCCGAFRISEANMAHLRRDQKRKESFVIASPNAEQSSQAIKIPLLWRLYSETGAADSVWTGVKKPCSCLASQACTPFDLQEF